MFCGPTKPNLKCVRLRAYVFRKPEGKMIPDCIVAIVKHGGRSIMAWGCIGTYSVGDLIKIEEILKKRTTFVYFT